jgi:phospholipid/cholesterol/gamma-HCH transport system ATP-binding protein
MGERASTSAGNEAREDPLIRFEGIRKAFDRRSVIYDGLSLSVRRGETLALIGGSGVGKSVLLKMLIGLIRPDAGSIFFDGLEITHLSEAKLLPVRKRISMLFQGGALFDSLDVGQNIAYPLREHSHLDEARIAERVKERLSLVGLEGVEHVMPADLSGGMKKRVALARAIAGDPEVLLYDEPTTGLDPPNTRRISELINRIQEQLHVTSIVVTHDLASVYVVADRIALLQSKKITAILPPDELRTSSDPTIREFVSAMPLPSREAIASVRRGAT